MNKELEKKLQNDFPEIFFEADLPPTETAMCWGFACDDGWYDLIYKLCEDIMEHCTKNKYEIPKAIQVKEKFGMLRFYTLTAPDSYIFDLIVEAEEESTRICEVCGTRENVKLRDDRCWLKTLCDKCNNESNQYKKGYN